MIKVICPETITNTIMIKNSLNLKPEQKECPFLPLVFNFDLKVLANTTKQGNNYCTQIRQ